MTPVCCSRCRLRFTPDVVAYLVMCPECGGPVDRIASFERAVGFRLFGPQDIPHSRKGRLLSAEEEVELATRDLAR